MNLLHNLLRWPWTPWADILTFSHGGGYLLQGRRNRITGRAQFAVRKMGAWWRVESHAPAPSEDALRKVGLWNPEP